MARAWQQPPRTRRDSATAWCFTRFLLRGVPHAMGEQHHFGTLKLSTRASATYSTLAELSPASEMRPSLVM